MEVWQNGIFICEAGQRYTTLVFTISEDELLKKKYISAISFPPQRGFQFFFLFCGRLHGNNAGKKKKRKKGKKKHILALKKGSSLILNSIQLLSGAYFGGGERRDKTTRRWSEVYFLHLRFRGDGQDGRARSHLCTDGFLPQFWERFPPRGWCR